MATLQERAQEALDRLTSLSPPSGSPRSAEFISELEAVNAEFGGVRGFEAALGGQVGDELPTREIAPAPSVSPLTSTTQTFSGRPPPLTPQDQAIRAPTPQGSPFVPGPAAGPPQTPQAPQAPLGQIAEPSPIPISPPQTPEEQQDFTSQWLKFVSKPEVQAGFLQFALNVLQPVPSSQSTLGAVARSAAGGLQAASRVGDKRRAEETLRRKEGREERKLDIQESAVSARLEAARISAGKPVVKAATLPDGTKVLRFFDPKGEQLNEVPLGIDPSTIKFNLAKVRFDLAQRKQGLAVQDPLVNSFTPKQAEGMLDSLGASSDNIFSALAALSGGGGESTAPPSTDAIGNMSVKQINALTDAQLDAINEAPELRTALQDRISELTPTAPGATPGEVPIQ